MVMMVMVDGRVELVLFYRYGLSQLSIRIVGALLLGGWLAGWCLTHCVCLCSCRRQGAGWQG